MRKRAAGCEGKGKKVKECKSKRKHQGKKTLCCMEQPPKQRWKEQKTGKRREKGENLVYFLALCPGDSLPASIFLSLSLASSNLSLFLLSTSCSESYPSLHFFPCTQGAILLLFHFFTFPLSLWHLLFIFIFSFFWLQSGIFLSCALFVFTPTFWWQLHAPATPLTPLLSRRTNHCSECPFYTVILHLSLAFFLDCCLLEAGTDRLP